MLAACLAYSIASGALPAISRASAIVRAAAPPRTARRRPRRAASRARRARRWPVKNMRRRVERPNRVLSMEAPPARPTLISGMPQVAFSEAYRMSQAAVRPKPAPSAAPLMAAITGLAHSRIAVAGLAGDAVVVEEVAGLHRHRGDPSGRRRLQKMLPAPVRTAQRTSLRSEISIEHADDTVAHRAIERIHRRTIQCHDCDIGRILRASRCHRTWLPPPGSCLILVLRPWTTTICRLTDRSVDWLITPGSAACNSFDDRPVD